MHNLLTLGLDQFDSCVDQVIKGIGCACSRIPIREVRPSVKYEFGTDSCSEVAGTCGVVEYLIGHTRELDVIRKYIKHLAIEDKTDEIKRAEAFLEEISNDPNSAAVRDPCLNVGDLMIALESISIPVFYTLNGKESLVFCVALRQVLIVQPIDPANDAAVWNFDGDDRPPS